MHSFIKSAGFGTTLLILGLNTQKSTVSFLLKLLSKYSVSSTKTGLRFLQQVRHGVATRRSFRDAPRPPRYKPKSGESLVVFTNQQCCIRDGALIFPKKAQMPPIKTRIKGGFRQIRVIPRGNHYLVKLVYDVTTFNLRLDSQRVISIDLGLTNLVTVVNNAGLQPWRVKGGLVKSINQFYKKTRARLCALRQARANWITTATTAT